jgi:hypothetical protein
MPAAATLGEDGTSGVVAGAESEDFIEVTEGEPDAMDTVAGVEVWAEGGVGHRELG